MEGGRGKPRDDEARDRRGERRERGGRRRERRGRDTRDKDRGGKRPERSYRQPYYEKPDPGPQMPSPMKPPIILTKPMAERVLQESKGRDQPQQPGLITIQKREDPASGSSLSSGLRASKPVSADSIKRHPQDHGSLFDPRDPSKFQRGSSGPAQAGLSGPGIVKVDHVVTGLAALKIMPKNMESVLKVVDDSFHWSDKAFNFLLDESDYVVIGVVGSQGAGKSTILSMIADGKCITSLDRKLLFRPQSKQDVEKSQHRTEGIDMYVTEQRQILLDTQPMLSPSILDRFLRHEKKVPNEFGTAEICTEMQSLQILSFLYTVCHVVVVVLDHFADPSLLKLLKTAEMLKPSSVAHAGQESSSSGIPEEYNEYYPHVVFAYNRCKSEMFSMDHVRQIVQVTSKYFAHSRLKIRGSASIIRDQLLPFFTLKPFASFRDLNIVLIPEYDIKDDNNGQLSMSEYHGRPSFATLVSTMRRQLMSMPRRNLTHHSLTEKNWFHYAARTWDVVKKSLLLSEYQRMVSS